jgi:hypothetical protein
MTDEDRDRAELADIVQRQTSGGRSKLSRRPAASEGLSG